MGFLSRIFDDRQTKPAASVDDDVPSLLRTVDGLVLDINRSSGELPPVGVVLARTVTDAVQLVLTAPYAAATLDIDTRVAIKAVLSDYLPGTLRAYVQAVRMARADQVAKAQDALVDQLLTLREQVEQIATATRDRDLTSQRIHGRFLRDKFGEGGKGSELQL